MPRPSPVTGILLVVVVLLLLSSPSPPAAPFLRARIEAAIAHEEAALSVLQNASYNDFGPNDRGARWLNLTGLREGDGFAWHILGAAQEKARAQSTWALGDRTLPSEEGGVDSDGSSPLLWNNISGSVRGRWVRDQLFPSTAHINLTAVAPDVLYGSEDFGRNVTGREGELRFELIATSEPSRGGALYVSAWLGIEQEASFGQAWEFSLRGVHHTKYGGILLTTTSEKFDGIFALPQFVLSADDYPPCQAVLNDSITKAIEKQSTDPEDASINPWGWRASDTEQSLASPVCELIVYLQLHAVAPSAEGDSEAEEDYKMLSQAEAEMRFPTGDHSSFPERLGMSMTAYSPDCGYLLTSKGPPDCPPQDGLNLRGPKAEVFVRDSKYLLLLLAAILAGQTYFVTAEIKRASTQSKKSKISFYTLAMLSLGSSFTGLAFVFRSSIARSTFLAMMVLGFAGILDGFFVTLKFSMDVWTAQEPERLERNRRRQQERALASASSSETEPTLVADSTPAPADVSSGAAVLPLPATATAPPPPAPATPTATTFASIMTRYMMLLMCIIFLSIATLMLPPKLRVLYTNALSFAYLSFWVPQIHRNIVRNSRAALSLRFVLGQSVLRALPFAYLWGVADNILFAAPARRTLALFAAWLWLQVVLLAAQQLVGPRCFVRAGWAWVPVGWDYHATLRSGDEEAAAAVFPPAEDARDGRSRAFDCAICMQAVDVPLVAGGGARAAAAGFGFLARKEYMVTPCRHVFHTACLDQWIDYRLQCPVCRETLPPT